MSLWSEIVKTAIIGSERQVFTAAQTADSLNSLIARLDNGDRERSLLTAAAAAALYERAGRLPIKDTQELPQACIRDDLPSCSTQAVEHLRLMLGGVYQELLPEWLARACAAGRRAREDILPLLLELGRSRSELSDAILHVLGHRGKWLAAQNSDWDEIFGFEDGSVWERGSLEQRRAFLALLRMRDPARARQLLLSVWEHESPRNRSVFLGILARGLSQDDEPFLESALDDKWTIVRRAAADLLSGLPESAFVERMTERAERLISFKNNARGRFGIEIILPVERDEGMMRDGIVKVPPHSQIGEKAWWLQQILSAVPPSFWLQSSQSTVSDLLKITKKSEWSQVLLNAWSRAAISFGDVEWIECLLEVSSNYMPAEDLFAALPPDRQEAMVGRLLRKDSTWSSINQLYWFIKSCRHQWSEHFSSEVVIGLNKHHGKYVLKNDIVLRNIITMIVCHLHPLIIPEAISGLNKVTRQITKRAPVLEHFLDMIQFRYEMLKEIEK